MSSLKPEGDFNPYAPPSTFAEASFGAGTDDDAPEILADRGTRLGAVLLDGLVMFAGMIPSIVLFALEGFSAAQENRSVGSGMFMILGFLLLVVPFAVVVYQWYLTAKFGQTLGKKWTGIKIVKIDGTPIDFVSGVILRGWIVGFLSNIPYIGFIVGLVDGLMIFGDDRRCLHDKIAGTKVIVAPPST